MHQLSEAVCRGRRELPDANDAGQEQGTRKEIVRCIGAKANPPINPEASGPIWPGPRVPWFTNVADASLVICKPSERGVAVGVALAGSVVGGTIGDEAGAGEGTGLA